MQAPITNPLINPAPEQKKGYHLLCLSYSNINYAGRVINDAPIIAPADKNVETNNCILRVD